MTRGGDLQNLKLVTYLICTPIYSLFYKLQKIFTHWDLLTGCVDFKFGLNVPYKEVNRLPPFSIVCIATVCFTDQSMCIIYTSPKAVPIISFFNNRTLVKLVDPERWACELIYRLVCKLEGRQVDLSDKLTWLTFRKPLFFYQDVQQSGLKFIWISSGSANSKNFSSEWGRKYFRRHRY